MVKIVGRVDLKTGIIYDKNGKIVPRHEPKMPNLDLERITERRREFFSWF